MNVTPLVDVVLVLLIIFMVVIPMMDKAVVVELPSIFKVDDETKAKNDPFTLSVTKNGSMYLEQDPLTEDTFVDKLRAASAQEPHRKLILRADRQVHYEQVRKMFKICQEVGFAGISLRVAEAKEPGAPVAAKH